MMLLSCVEVVHFGQFGVLVASVLNNPLFHSIIPSGTSSLKSLESEFGPMMHQLLTGTYVVESL